MAFQTNRIEVDGSINIDGSIFQYGVEFTGGGGGGGTGDVAWASGDVGSNNEIITAAGDGSIVSESNLTFDGTTVGVTGNINLTGDLSIGNNAYLGTGKYLYFTSGSFFIRENAAKLTIAGSDIEISASGDLIFDAFTGNSYFLSGVQMYTNASIGGDLLVTGDIYNEGMDASIKDNVVYYDTTTKRLTYGAPAAADISTLSIESYVNSSSYYDASIKDHFFPNPSTGLGNTESQGLYVRMVAGASVPNFSLVTVDTGGKAILADADSSTLMPAIAMNTTGGTTSAGTEYNYLIYGVVRNTSWAFTIGRPIYVSTSGTATSTAPTGTADVVQIIGIAISPDSFVFNPAPVFIVI